MTGRPTKYTRKRADFILALIRAGNTKRAACLAAGITTDTLANWSRRNSAFSASLSTAEGQSEAALVAIIRRAADSDWKAAAHLLACRFPGTWTKRDSLHVTVSVLAEKYAAALDGVSMEEIVQQTERIIAEGAA